MIELIKRMRRFAIKRVRGLIISINPIRYISEKMAVEGIVKYFENKSCILLGPNSILSDELKKKIIKANVCTFVNKGYRKEIFKQVKSLNSNCVLFHCLDPAEKTGGGQINSILLRLIGIKEIFYPLNESKLYNNIKEFHNKNFGLLRLHTATTGEYNEVKKDLKNFVPNTGAAAIFLISMANNVKLYISGFSFHRTNYPQDYHSHLNSLSDTVAFIEKYGSHNPDLDFLKFKKFVKKYNIEYDEELEKILSEKYVPIFYQKKEK